MGGGLKGIAMIDVNRIVEFVYSVYGENVSLANLTLKEMGIDQEKDATSSSMGVGKKCFTVVEKPPLGIMPERIWKQRRAEELTDAIFRYIYAQSYDKIKKMWLSELEGLINDLANTPQST